MLAPTLLLLGQMVNALLATNMHWKRVTEIGDNPRPPARKEAAIACDTLRHYVVLFGGRAESKRLYSDTWIFDVLAGRWYVVDRDVHPPALYGSVYGLHEGKFYIAGGCGSESCYSDVWVFFTSTFEWHKLEAQGDVQPAARISPIGGYHSHGGHIIYGLGRDTDGRFLEDIYFFDINTRRWYKAVDRLLVYNPFNAHPRSVSGSVMIGQSELFIFGGCIKHGPCPSGDAWLFNLQSRAWQALSNCATPRLGPSMVALQLPENKDNAKVAAVLVYGGSRHTSQHLFGSTMIDIDEVIVYDLERNVWTIHSTRPQASTELPEQRSFAPMAASLTEVYMFGGEAYDGRLLDDFWMLSGDWRGAGVKEQCQLIHFNLLALHGLFMSIAVAALMPLGAYIALYKSAKAHADAEDNWKIVHTVIQALSVFTLTIGLSSAIYAKSDSERHFQSVHGALGVLLTIVIGTQVALGICNHFLPTAKRLVSSRVHFWMALLVLPLLFLNCILGLQLITAPLVVLFTFFAHVSCLMAGLGLVLPVVRWRQGSNKKENRQK